jgi:hypothetical protein
MEGCGIEKDVTHPPKEASASRQMQKPCNNELPTTFLRRELGLKGRKETMQTGLGWIAQWLCFKEWCQNNRIHNKSNVK